jgi:hypothetical protein
VAHYQIAIDTPYHLFICVKVSVQRHLKRHILCLQRRAGQYKIAYVKVAPASVTLFVVEKNIFSTSKND